MKKSAFIFLPFSILANAAFLSLGMTCLLNLLGLALAISLDSSPQYPRFIPFCIVCGTAALLGLIATFIINIKTSEKFNFTKSLWLFEYIFALVLSVPMIKLWEMLFSFLQKTL